ncbi:YidC/Oxa1 family membrane protein insertase [Chengkuizengella axinellae]|uniref:Membrane protein insertase YidC n=1 Tax=Chengkuizengella axinellae TaxID=3064388 RepID=A0ABT9J3E1_9BACL|nr:YidC/Oxa1 family membrane protein insertase [Chengkuizengella sp. 2205SS18-9]MDP5276078.1 YidC/Oxa1 family membrane protein insertase [Chengkuizengella sp. 2205SS18-9]
MSRRLPLLLVLLSLTVLLAGCSMEDPIDPENGFWDKYFVNPLSVSLDWFADLPYSNYGISILIVTIIIRLLILPLTLKQIKSSKQMQEIQPEIKKLKEKYKTDPKKQQEETMRLFQKNGINPLAGCLPLIVQMPILIALYNAIMRNDLISNSTFLWLQLGERDPYILPILAAFTTYLQSKMMSSQMSNQMQGMQGIMMIFPVLIFVMALTFPSALPLYWVYGNIFTIIQSYFIYGNKKSEAPKEGGLSK